MSDRAKSGNLALVRAVTSTMKTSSFIHRNSLLALALAAALGSSLHAQEKILLEEGQRVARKLTASIATISDAPFAVDADVDKPQGIKAQGVGLLALPDRKLTIKTLNEAGAAIVPVGELWTLKVSVAADGKAPASERLRLVTVTDEEKSREVQLYFLGAAKSEQGKLELIVFAKDREPLLRVPLAQLAGAKQEYPIEVAGQKKDDTSATLFLRLFGEYEAQLPVTKAE
jgi:hypothetical protein